jgi:hypothetical protein
MHVSCGTAAEARDEQQRELAIQVFQDCPDSVGLTWLEAHERIESLKDLTRSGARKRFEKLIETKHIRKAGEKSHLASGLTPQRPSTPF